MWCDVAMDEFRAVIGIIVYMGMIPLKNIQEYWSVSDTVGSLFFNNIFTRERFKQIFWMLRLKTPKPARND